jgi:hypothetical protein
LFLLSSYYNLYAITFTGKEIKKIRNQWKDALGFGATAEPLAISGLLGDEYTL